MYKARCRHEGIDWNGKGDCIKCARDKVLGSMNDEELERELREISLFPIRDINNGVVDPPGSWGLTNGQLEEILLITKSRDQQIALDTLTTLVDKSDCIEDQCGLDAELLRHNVLNRIRELEEALKQSQGNTLNEGNK